MISSLFAGFEAGVKNPMEEVKICGVNASRLGLLVFLFVVLAAAGKKAYYKKWPSKGAS